MLTLILAGLMIPGLPAYAQSGSTRIAVVDLDTVVATSEAGKALQARLEKFQKQVRVEADTKTQIARSIQNQLTEGANALSEDRLAELQRQYEDATQELRRLQNDKQREGQKLQENGLREIEKQLQPILEKIRQEDQYDVVFNSVPGIVVMVNERVDITARVLELLNRGE